ncbi:MAG TPA: hypothetical protein VML01_00135 [Bryobacterales bacterium]|nr:hypothetical protein [Bryobacterales bacterium]
MQEMKVYRLLLHFVGVATLLSLLVGCDRETKSIKLADASPEELLDSYDAEIEFPDAALWKNREITFFPSLRWGMTEVEVSKNCEHTLIQTEKTEEFYKSYVPFVIKDYELFSEPFFVRFQFSKEDHSLEQILFSYEGFVDNTSQSRETLRKLHSKIAKRIQERYGEPTKNLRHEIEPDGLFGDSVDIEDEWNLGENSIELSVDSDELSNDLKVRLFPTIRNFRKIYRRQ